MIAEFFGLPHSLVRGGGLKKLNGTSMSVLIFLWYESERLRSRELTLKDSYITRFVKAHRNSLATARTELKRAGFVIVEPFGPKGFVYQLCDPGTGQPWPGPPDVQIKYVKKFGCSRAESSSQPRHNRERITNSKLAGVNFPFGHNAPDAHVSERPSEGSSSSGPRWDEIGRR